MIYGFSSCRCASLAVTSYISHFDVHTGRSTTVSVVFMFMFKPLISLSLFSLWLCHDSQSAMNSSWPGLCSVCSDVCIELYTTDIVIMLPHLCPLQLPTVNGL